MENLSNWENAILDDINGILECNYEDVDKLSFIDKRHIILDMLGDDYVWQSYDERLESVVRKYVKESDNNGNN